MHAHVYLTAGQYTAICASVKFKSIDQLLGRAVA